MNRKNLKQFYKEKTGKYAFVRIVAKRCGISSNAVLRWCQGDGETSVQERLNILSEETGIEVTDLFNRDLD